MRNVGEGAIETSQSLRILFVLGLFSVMSACSFGSKFNQFVETIDDSAVDVGEQPESTEGDITTAGSENDDDSSSDDTGIESQGGGTPPAAIGVSFDSPLIAINLVDSGMALDPSDGDTLLVYPPNAINGGGDYSSNPGSGVSTFELNAPTPVTRERHRISVLEDEIEATLSFPAEVTDCFYSFEGTTQNCNLPPTSQGPQRLTFDRNLISGAYRMIFDFIFQAAPMHREEFSTVRYNIEKIFDPSAQTAITGLHHLGGELYFTSNSASLNKLHVYRSNQTETLNLYQGWDDEPKELAMVGGSIYFSANDRDDPAIATASHREKLYRYTPIAGNQDQFEKMIDTNVGDDSPTEITELSGNRMLMATNFNGARSLVEYRIAEGTLRNITVPGVPELDPRDLVRWRGTGAEIERVYFTGNTTTPGIRTLYVYWEDSTPLHLPNVARLMSPAPENRDPRELTIVDHSNGPVLYMNLNDSSGRNLYLSMINRNNPGAPMNIIQMHVIRQDLPDDPQNLISYQQGLIFSAINQDGFRKLFRIQDSAGPVHELKEISNTAGDTNDDNPSLITVFKGNLLFKARNTDGNQKLMLYDGFDIVQLADFIVGANDPIDHIVVSASGGPNEDAFFNVQDRIFRVTSLQSL